MAAQNVCKFFKFGYCKHREFCRREHVKDICEKSECDISMCSFRHPKVCKYYRDYRKCKFNPCMFLHVEKENDPETEKLKKENESILKQIVNLEKNIDDLNDKILQSEDIIAKLVEVEQKFERVINIEKHFCEKSSAIEILINKVQALENKLLEKDDIIKDLTEKVNSLFEDNLSATFPCDKCDLVCKNESELTEHTTKTHTNDENDTEEENVSACEEPNVTISSVELSENITNNITNVVDDKVLQCEKCNFKSSSEHGLKIHTTKKHSKFSYNSTMRTPVQNRGQFSPRCPPRLPPRFPQSFPPYPMSPYDV